MELHTKQEKSSLTLKDAPSTTVSVAVMDGMTVHEKRTRTFAGTRTLIDKVLLVKIARNVTSMVCYFPVTLHLTSTADVVK